MESNFQKFDMFENTTYHILYTIFMLLAIPNVSETQHESLLFSLIDSAMRGVLTKVKFLT